MRLGTRRRLILALIVVCLVSWAPMLWWFQACWKLTHYLSGGTGMCGGDWRDFGNCGNGSNYNATYGWLEVLGFLALIVALGWLASRWTLAPVRTMTDMVRHLGPTSLGLRLTPAHAKDETGHLTQALNGMLDRVAEGYESQRRFAANASHELRTPLATQRALIEVSLADALTPDQLHLLSKQLLATNERNEALIEGLLALAETERGLMAHASLRLDEIAVQVIERLRPAIDKAGLQLEIAATPVSIVGEPPLVDRLVSNLVENATKYNQHGGRILVRVTQPGTLTVSNTGPDVPAAAVPGLFEPFRRMSGDRLEHGGGAGLGLTIVRSIVAAHAGSVDAYPNPEGGLTITVRLPPGGA